MFLALRSADTRKRGRRNNSKSVAARPSTQITSVLVGQISHRRTSCNVLHASRIPSASCAVCCLPSTLRSVSFNDCTPSDTRLIPASRKAVSLSPTLALGFTSKVISASLGRRTASATLSIILCRVSGSARLGVPPPKKIELTRFTWLTLSKLVSSVSRQSLILVWSIDLLTYLLKLQYVHLFSQ